MSGAAPNKLYAVDNTPGILLTASTNTAQTIWMLEPVTNPYAIVEFGISFNASVSSTPAQVDLYYAASVGSSAGNSASVRTLGSTTTAATTTARTNFTVEPNPSTKQILSSWFIQPFGGALDIQYPLGREGMSIVGGSATTGLALQVTSPVAVWAISYVWLEE